MRPAPAWARCAHRAPHYLLLRPGRLVHQGRRGVRRYSPPCSSRRQTAASSIPGGQEDAPWCAPCAGQGGDALPLGHRGASRHAGDDDALAHPGQGVLHAQRQPLPRRRRTPPGYVIGDAPLGPAASICSRTAPYRQGSPVWRRTVFPPAALGRAPAPPAPAPASCWALLYIRAPSLTKPQKGRVYQAARVDDAVRPLRSSSAPRRVIRSGAPGPAPYKMDHGNKPPCPHGSEDHRLTRFRYAS